MYAPHKYNQNGSFKVHAALTAAGCAQPRAAHSATLSDDVRVTGVPGGAAHAAAATTPQQWTSFDQSGPQLPQSTLSMVSGAPLAGGGCALTTPELVLTPTGANKVTGREDAIDYTTCQYLWESGAPAGSVVPAVRAHTSQYTVWESQVESLAASRDLLGANLNSIGNTLRWRYNGGCTTELANWSAYPFPAINWHTDNFNKSATQDCTHAIIWTNAIFEDDNFCPNAIYNIFNKDNLAGHYDGSAAKDVSWSVPPNCAIEHLTVDLWWDYSGKFIHH